MILIVVPWLTFWDRNYIVEALPVLHPIVQNNFVRGAVSGIGVLNVIAGLYDLHHAMPWNRNDP